MCQFFAVTPFSFTLTEPRKRNYVNQINPCKMLQPLGVCGICPASESTLTVQLGLDPCASVTLGPTRGLKYGDWRLQHHKFT